MTAAATVEGHPRLRQAPRRSIRGRACDAVLRLLDSVEANPAAHNLLCRYLALLDEGSATGLPTALAFRLKLTLAAGFAPELTSCARCGEVDGLVGPRARPGGWCAARGGRGLLAGRRYLAFMVEASSRSRPPRSAENGPLRQVDRAISETLEYHACAARGGGQQRHHGLAAAAATEDALGDA